MKSLIISITVSLIVLAAPSLAHAQDAAAGKKVFKRCVSCHTVEKDGRNKVGPNLWGIFGSTAAQRNVGYKYSRAMKASGIIWDEATLSSYLQNPRKAVPKTRMAFAGLKKAKQRDDVIAYLKSVTE
ncbi:MAG: cytochrome c family protein [Alphaproteobacteria bacterium]|nr:cytochrome c family protein [Alphaproteobacteria bacterium]